jgi:alpha-galactosidase
VGDSPGFRDDPRRVVSTRDPSRIDWLSESLTDGWKPGEFWGETICLADTAARDWCLDLLRAVVKDNKLDMLEHDQRMICDNCPRTDHVHTRARVDIAYRAAQGYYHVYDVLRSENPNLLFEDCVNGGQMVDFGVIRRVHYISITDTYDPLSNRRAFFDSSYLIPPAMCECYVDQHPGKTAANFLYMLRSGMMGWCTIMLDTTQWTAQQHELAKRQFELYKSRLRPLINNADLYHVSDRPDGIRWDGIEYFDPKTGSGVLFAFRGTTGEAKHSFVIRGLDPNAKYDVEFEDSGTHATAIAGSELMGAGIKVSLAEPESSEIAYIHRR